MKTVINIKTYKEVKKTAQKSRKRYQKEKNISPAFSSTKEMDKYLDSL